MCGSLSQHEHDWLDTILPDVLPDMWFTWSHVATWMLEAWEVCQESWIIGAPIDVTSGAQQSFRSESIEERVLQACAASLASIRAELRRRSEHG